MVVLKVRVFAAFGSAQELAMECKPAFTSVPATASCTKSERPLLFITEFAVVFFFRLLFSLPFCDFYYIQHSTWDRKHRNPLCGIRCSSYLPSASPYTVVVYALASQ